MLDLEGAAITAVLGPTNTGKTHRAIQRMLAHRTGMMGLPLRLLAREVYERVAAQRGREVVALCTGEERIEPPGTRYWICTAEAMPVQKPVAFLAVDEIQLCAHPERGHVFTERLLHARGTKETWFLGSEAMSPWIEALLPTARVERRPRLSTLRHDGPHRLSQLPKRSAVIAFSAPRVYELAERLRRRRGGAAVVLGALSPRTRNAQVALFQSGEVPYLVATDAIGMGLNLDLDHVAFSALRRFDGRTVRALSGSELGQIAGRAGRYRRDGTFGALEGECELPAEQIAQVEAHRPDPIPALCWRNAELDFSSPRALLESLGRRPPKAGLWMQTEAQDQLALRALVARLPEAARMGEEATRRLWAVCQVPDFRDTLPEAHIELLLRLHGWLAHPDGQIPEAALQAALRRLDRIDGDIETLMARLAAVRTWTYVCQREGWVPRADQWQARTREVEDRLSDALHEGLIARFVDRRTRVSLPGRAPGEAEVQLDAEGEVWLLGQRVGRVRGFSLQPDPRGLPASEADTERLVRRTLTELLAARLGPPDDLPPLTTDPDGTFRLNGQVVGQLHAGGDPAAPRVQAARLDLLGEPHRAAILARLEARRRELLERTLGPLLAPPELGREGRAILEHLRPFLGAAPSAPLRSLVQALSPRDRRVLGRAGIRLGWHHVYWLPGIEPEALAARALLLGLAPALPALGAPALPRPADLSRAQLLRLGYAPLGPRALRLDELERLDAWARGAAVRGGIDPASPELASLGEAGSRAAGLRALGYREGRRGRYHPRA